MADEGASNNERMLDAAKNDNEELILEIFEKEGSFNINFQDGLGNTALHYAASRASTDVLEHILEQDGCDVDLQNRIEGYTPLHLAVRIAHPDARKAVVESLLDAGADQNVKDKHGQRPIDSVPFTDIEIRALFRKAQAEASVNQADIANDSDGEPGSGSGSDDD